MLPAPTPAVTPGPDLRQRDGGNEANSLIMSYETTNGIYSTVACSENIACLQITTVTPAAAICSGEPLITKCFDGTNLPTTACNSEELCCTASNTCGTYNINNGQVIARFCNTRSWSLSGWNSNFIGYGKKTAVSATTTAEHAASPSSSSASSSSSNSDLALGIGVVVGGVAAVAAIIAFLWWGCCMRRPTSWWNSRKKYNKLHDPPNQGQPSPFAAQASYPQDGSYSNTYSNPSYPMGPVSTGYTNTNTAYQSGASYQPVAQSAAPISTPPAPAYGPVYQANLSQPTITTTPPPAASALAAVPAGRSNAQWQPSDQGKTTTYRIEFIPNDFTKEDVKNRLFSLTDRMRVTVRSLGPSVTGMKQTATIEFPSLFKNSSGPSLSSEAKEMNVSLPDRGFQGWTPLNQPEEPIYADVIAVTGLAGHAFGSWSVDHHLMWLRDFLPSDIPRIRVITYGYNSQLTETMSRQDFDLHAEDFAEGLEALWRSNYFTRPTILVGHSLGCLIIKQALILSKGWKGRPERLENLVPLLIFMGAPHNGLATDALMTLVKGKASESLIDELKPGSPTLRNLKFRFDDMAQNIKVLSVFERRETPTAIEKNGKWVREGPPVMMVEKQNAVTYLPLETRISSDTDHKGISKLSHTDGGTYGPIKRAICEALEIAPSRSLGFDGGYFPSQ